jgi:hypothetical protein
VEEVLTTTVAGEGGAAAEVGVPRPARRWAFAGSDEADADALMSVYNPGARPITVRLLALTAGGGGTAPSTARRTLEPGERDTFVLSELAIDQDQALFLRGDGAFVVERLLLTSTGRSLDTGVAAR